METLSARERMRLIAPSINNFEYFINNIFSLSFKKFVPGKHINDVARFMQSSPRTMRIGPRDHFKSTGIYAYLMWKMMKDTDDNVNTHYFSFEQKMASFHISKIRDFVADNIIFNECKDLKPTAEGIAQYTWDGKHTFSIIPHGMLGFKRGIHDKYIVVDDPFQDPAKKMDPLIIRKVNRIFKAEILPMPSRMDGEIHCVGTVQTNTDFLLDENFYIRKDNPNGFAVYKKPAILDWSNKKVLWPEWMNYDELMKRKRETGDKLFNQEYMIIPAYEEASFFKRDDILVCVNTKLKNKPYQEDRIRGDVIAGWDLGLKRHPSHFAVFVKKEGSSKKVMLFSRFMYKMPFDVQVKSIKAWCESLGIDRVYFDNTRGEMEAYMSSGILDFRFVPIVFSLKSKGAMSASLDKAVSNRDVEFINDSILVDHLCLVTNDLKSIESESGHGDAFWSVGLALYGFDVEGGNKVRFDFV